MPHHLMNLRNVPDDEADDIRALFEEHEVRYYETPPSRWGISMGGFWVHDDDEAERARALLDDYQARRLQAQREDYLARCQRGETGLWYQFRRRPVTFLAALIAIAVILGLSLLPFIRLG
ncbi:MULTISPECIES: DUF6164 family protein [Marinobacter]|jgi:hypothetical protein|uniref:Transmembrane protein n=1 Tax=Marinobacter excellens LAMA 842 TaxID=1306954 RepID=A0A137SGE2_9GAMM|nr:MULTISPECIES: DUF6164 family protein [Marinobacter]PKM03633.1 MAG: hypothetical protein CVV16_08240 [Gammaproteobacteria bacterium HGW-Gammaproteobacteria-6]KXO10815.1 hypothetical protein J122_1446 [Marinobacter excellens LAMA 842]KXO11480.1 hypothetical protein J122_939 [Marinobacter excellens LAMA 842]MAO15143.1 hypothetical protein [Marinobacter sp.]MCD1629237.1 DUF6164 family protein [Marinobacter shengliensis]